jgi:hypothetical protein
MKTPLKTRDVNVTNNVSVVKERKKKEDYNNSSVTSSSSSSFSIFRKEHANHSFTIPDGSNDDDNKEKTDSDDQMSVMMDQITRGDNHLGLVGLDHPHTTTSSALSSSCDQQEEGEWRTPSKSGGRRRRKKKGARNVPMTEQTFVSASLGKSPQTISTSSPPKFTLSQPVNSSRVRPVDVTSTSAATSTDETSQDGACSPSTLASAAATTQTTAHENRSRIAMKRSFAVLEKHMAHQHIERLSDKENAGSSETEDDHSLFHTPDEALHTFPDKPAEPVRERPSGKENGASKLSSFLYPWFHTPPSSPFKEHQDEDTSAGSVNTDTSLDTNSGEDGEVKVRVIRFADEVGKPLEDYHWIGGKDDPHATRRIIIMLLCPQERKFEFLHAEFLLRETTTVADALYQVPKIATNELFKSKTFINLCRTRQGNTDLDNDRILQDYDMEDSELVIGVLEGFTGKQMAQCALPLLLNGKITQAVSESMPCLCYSRETWYREPNASNFF